MARRDPVLMTSGPVARRSHSGRHSPCDRSGGARWALWLPVFVAIIVLLAFAEQLHR